MTQKVLLLSETSACTHTHNFTQKLKEYHYSDTSDAVSCSDSVVTSSELSFQFVRQKRQTLTKLDCAVVVCSLRKKEVQSYCKWQEMERKGIYKGKELPMHVEVNMKLENVT